MCSKPALLRIRPSLSLSSRVSRRLMNVCTSETSVHPSAELRLSTTLEERRPALGLFGRNQRGEQNCRQAAESKQRAKRLMSSSTASESVMILFEFSAERNPC